MDAKALVASHEAALESLRSIIECFKVRRGWIYHKAEDGEWMGVNEDLHYLLEEAKELLEETRDYRAVLYGDGES